jgi:hypothetical protein
MTIVAQMGIEHCSGHVGEGGREDGGYGSWHQRSSDPSKGRWSVKQQIPRVEH